MGHTLFILVPSTLWNRVLEYHGGQQVFWNRRVYYLYGVELIR